jgi:hypothetical protein
MLIFFAFGTHVGIFAQYKLPHLLFFFKNLFTDRAALVSLAFAGLEASFAGLAKAKPHFLALCMIFMLSWSEILFFSNNSLRACPNSSSASI